MSVTRNKAPKLAVPKDPAERYVIPNLRNACHILRLLSQFPEGVKPADIHRQLKIPVTTTLRIMATLCLEGYAAKVEGRFKLGPVLINLGQSALQGTEIRDLAVPVVQALSEATEETAHLAIPCDFQPLILVVHHGMHPLRAASRPGTIAEAHCSATGKIFLSYLHGGNLAAVVAKNGMKVRTEKTLTTLKQLERDCLHTRERGYATDEEEYHAGVRCLAVPVRGADGSVVAALGITASVTRFTPSRNAEIAAKVNAAAHELSRKLGYS